MLDITIALSGIQQKDGTLEIDKSKGTSSVRQTK